MKSNSLLQTERIGWRWAALLGLWVAVSPLSAADTNSAPAVATNAPPAAATNAPPVAITNAPEKQAEAPAALTPEQMFEGGADSYNNWIEFSAGGLMSSGNKSQFQQQQQARGGAFGGVEDFHFQTDLAKGTTLTLDGRALLDENDYKARVELIREKLGYIRLSFDQSRTWSSGDGGFYPPSGPYYALSGDALALDRGEFSVEAGLTLDKAPQVTFKYAHTYRDGQKSSTIWGATHPVLGSSNPVRGLAPSFYDLDERSDIFELDATHHIKATEFGVGVRYETTKLDDALKINQFPQVAGQPAEPVERKITDRQGTTYDLFNVHSFTESWIKKNLLLSTGFMYSDLDNEFSSSRIYGSDFDVGYVPALATGSGYVDLNGGSRLHEYVGNLNLLYKPWPHLSIVPSVRVQQEDMDADASGIQTSTASQNTQVPFNGTSERSDLDVRERLDVTYNGFTNWVLYARGELTEGSGNLTENGGLVPINGIGIPPVQRQTDDDRFFQKYSAGARWYPVRRLSLDAGGYYKRNEYDYDHDLDSTPNDSIANRYPAYLVMQNFETYDGNIRMTIRPRNNITAISRYEFQYSTINTTPDTVSGLGESQSSKMTSHIIAQDVSWTPWSRLYLQAGFNYVLSETKSPTSEYTQAVLDAQNNYWTLNLSSGLVLDNKTDLRVSYLYYRADNHQDIAPLDGVSYGAGAEEHGITATLTRRINKHLRWALKYGYSHYRDETYGANQDYDAHLVYSSLQYRF